MNRYGFVGENVTIFSSLSSQMREVSKAFAGFELRGAGAGIAHPL